MIQGYILYIGLFIAIWYIPASALPDSYEDSLGNKYDFPPEKKEDMKMFALYFIIIIGFFYIAINCYLYIIVKEWASKDKLIEHVKH